MSEKTITLAEGAQGLFVKNNRFNTTLVSFNFYLPLAGETVADYGLLPFILTTCCDKYPDFSRLNYKLDKLYGAQLSASTEKLGDCQLLRLSVSVINDRFTLDGESLVKQAAELMVQLIFEPRVQDGEFFGEDVEREKRKAIEHIRGELSEKRIYAKNRMIGEMYAGKPYGIPKCGSEKDVNAITGKSLYAAWQKMLTSAFVRVHVIGAAVPAGLFEDISAKLSEIQRSNITDVCVSEPTEPADSVNRITERMSVKQGKLVMGFSTDIYGDDSVSLPVLVMCDIFGGGTYSRLFANVREKMSLCYYCSAGAIRIKGLLTVDSGVEAKNAELAEKEILNQLEAVKKNEFTDFELQASLKSIADSLNGYNDSQGSLDLWYALKIADKTLRSPDDTAQMLSSVTRAEVVRAAKGVKLHTVYRLLPQEEAND